MRRAEIGRAGEQLCARELEKRGWTVEDLNEISTNMPNSDLRIHKAGQSFSVQVKSSARDRGYITGGSVNKTVVSGGPIFNRRKEYPDADFVVFIANLETSPRFFIVPVNAAEAIFRTNIDAYFLSPKLDGGPKRPSGQSDIFVGAGHFPHARIVPDQRTEILPYEGRWDILERSLSDSK